MAEDNIKYERLLDAFERIYPSMPKMIWRSFVHGLFTALGATVGLAIIASLVTYFVTHAQFIPKDYQRNIEQVLPGGK